MFNASDFNAFKANLDRFIATNRVHATTRDLTNIYATVPAAYTCANMRAENLADVEFIVVDANDKPSLDPRAQALQRVIDRNRHQYLFRSELTICFWGRNLLYKEQSLTDATIGLRWLNPHLYSLDLSAADGLRGFRINYSSNYETVEENYLDIDEVVYQTRPIDFHDDFDAISPAEVTFQHAGASAEMATTVLSLFRNMAIPAAIAQPAQDSQGGSATISEPQANMLTRMLRTVVQGAANFGKTIVSPTRWEWIQLQARFDQLAFKDISEEAKEAIFMGFRVPMVLVLGGANYAEQEGARRFWLQNWLVPQANWYAHTFTQQLAGEFGDFRIKADFRNIPALKEDDATRTNVYNSQLAAGGITLNEWREALGKGSVQNGDLYFMPGGSVQVHAAQLGVIQSKPTYLPLANPQTNIDTSSDMGQQMGIDTPTPPISPLGYDLTNADVTGIDTVNVDTTNVDTTNAPPIDDQAHPLPVQPKSRVDEALYAELQTWERISARKNRKDKPFECRHTPVHIENFISEGLKVNESATERRALFEGARALAAMKAIASTKGDFDRAFNNVLQGAMSADYTRAQFQTQLRRVLRQFGTAAYRDGLIDGGVIDGEFDDEDRANVATLLANQSGYIGDFGAALFAKDGGISEKLAGVKSELWWNKSVLPFYQAALISADKNGMYMWKMGATIEHCSTCRILDQQVHRLKDYAKRNLLPKSSSLECGGWECRCSITRVSERARGSFPNAARRSAKHAHVDGESADHIHADDFEAWDEVDGMDDSWLAESEKAKTDA